MQLVRPLIAATLAMVSAAFGDGAPVEKDPSGALALADDHVIADGRIAFKTPAGWVVKAMAGRSDAVEAARDSLVVRFVYPSGGAGFDSLHVSCMTEGLASAMSAAPQTRYEYDFLSSTVGKMRSLDSAFVVLYDEPVLGHRQWRQRNLTLVGEDRSLCAIAYAPLAVYKKSKEAKAALDAIVGSIRFP